MAADPLPSKPSGLATLAKRISVWTTNCLLTLLVLVAGLGFGRQVLKWWTADRSPPRNSVVGLPTDGLGDPMQLHTIQFGDSSWSLRRQSITDDKQRAIERLRAACREVLLHIDRPEEKPAASEDKFLRFLSNSKPADEGPGKWRLYEFHEALPMAVGVARPAPTAAGQSAEAEPNLVRSGYRVVVWGVAVPIGTEGWALYTFQPGVPSLEAGSRLTDIPLPPGGRKGLSLRAAGGGGLVAFHGPNHPQEWKHFYDDWFRSQAWQTVVDWQSAGAAWCAKFAPPDGNGSVDVRFGPDDRGSLSGLLMITPPEAK